MTTRRGFLGILGGAVVGGKKAAANAAATLSTGLNDFGYANEGISTLSFGIEPEGCPEGEGTAKRINDPSILRAIGIPEWLREEWRRDASQFGSFDSDIACLNSFSLSAKINLQRDRNLARYEKEFWERGLRQQEAKLWRKIHGAIGWW